MSAPPWLPWPHGQQHPGQHPQQPYYQQPNPNVYLPPHYPRAPTGYWQPPAWAGDAYGPRAPPITDNNSAKYPELNPILASDTTLLRFDVRKKPRTEILASTYYSNRNLPANAQNTLKMRLISKSFPWTIDIVSQANITCEAVWDAIYAALQEPIVDSEWGLILSNKKQREVMEKAYRKRLEEEGPNVVDKRTKRVDFLGDGTLFKGLEKDEEFEKARILPGTKAVKDTWVVKVAP